MPGILQKRRRTCAFEADAARKFQGKWEGTIPGRRSFGRRGYKGEGAGRRMPGILQKLARVRADAARKFQGKWEGTIRGRSRRRRSCRRVRDEVA